MIIKGEDTIFLLFVLLFVFVVLVVVSLLFFVLFCLLFCSEWICFLSDWITVSLHAYDECLESDYKSFKKSVLFRPTMLGFLCQQNVCAASGTMDNRCVFQKKGLSYLHKFPTRSLFEYQHTNPRHSAATPLLQTRL